MIRWCGLVTGPALDSVFSFDERDRSHYIDGKGQETSRVTLSVVVPDRSRRPVPRRVRPSVSGKRNKGPIWNRLLVRTTSGKGSGPWSGPWLASPDLDLPVSCFVQSSSVTVFPPFSSDWLVCPTHLSTHILCYPTLSTVFVEFSRRSREVYWIIISRVPSHEPK